MNKKYHREWKRKARKNPEYRRKSQKQNKESDCFTKLVKSGGICWICGELNPMVFEYHHLFGKEWERGKKNKHTKIGEDFCALCANCHRKFRASPQEKHVFLILCAIERGFLGGDKKRR
jgi:hypothetical protein